MIRLMSVIAFGIVCCPVQADEARPAYWGGLSSAALTKNPGPTWFVPTFTTAVSVTPIGLKPIAVRATDVLDWKQGASLAAAAELLANVDIRQEILGSPAGMVQFPAPNLVGFRGNSDKVGSWWGFFEDQNEPPATPGWNWASSQNAIGTPIDVTTVAYLGRDVRQETLDGRPVPPSPTSGKGLTGMAATGLDFFPQF